MVLYFRLWTDGFVWLGARSHASGPEHYDAACYCDIGNIENTRPQ